MRAIGNNHKSSFFILTLICYLFSLMSFALAQESALDRVLDENAAVITGRVNWGGHDISQTTIQVYKDESLKELYTTGILMEKQGYYELRLEPGIYYLVAFVDTNRNGRFDVGDGMGIYGITDWNDRSQQKHAITVTPKERRENLDISITAMMIQVDDKTQMVAANDTEVQQTKDFKTELDKLSTGITGLIHWSDHTLTNGIVLAYTDLSWNYRAAQAEVDEYGKFTLNVSPGKYYLLAIIDENGTNLFDVGDEFGIYGMNNLKDKFPKPVLVEQKKLTENVEIAIVGRQEESGRIISLQDGEEFQLAPGPETAKISGKVIWLKHSVNNSIIQVYNDQTLTRAIKEVSVDENGNFSLSLPAGDYYIIASVDADGDGKYSLGDGIGGYGTTDITQNPPEKLTLGEEDTQEIEIFISSEYDSSGQLQAIEGLRLDDNEAPFEGSGISGKIIWEGQKFKEVMLLISETSEFASGGKNVNTTTPTIVVPLEIEDDGGYAYPLDTGDYYITAIVDIDTNQKAGISDGVGVYGTNLPMTGKSQLITVFPNRITPHIDIYISAIYIDDQGGIAQINDGNRRNIRQQYGEPEDIYQFTQFGRKVEEWWYWTKGAAFTFEADGPGWKLKDSEDFKPKVHSSTEDSGNSNADTNSGNSNIDTTNPNENAIVNSEASEANPGTSLVDAIIYYTYDDIVWGLAPDSSQQPLSLGSYPTSTSDGFALSIVGIDGNIRIIEGDNPNGRIVLSRSDMVSDPVISPDGLYLAYVRRRGSRAQIFLKNLATGEEIPLPSTFRNYYTPAWNVEGDIIAFAASGSIEDLDQPPEHPSTGDDSQDNRNDNTARNIYIFDQIEQLLDPVSVGPEDDAEPAWPPNKSNTLVFSRAEGNHRQLWIAILDRDGKAMLRQFTRFGGQKPAWLPDGSGVVYENNGQLWTVDVNGYDERPLLIRGKPVFGLEPYPR
ncbi:PD40 domain-containing protein [bacterium]|nr:PD40 domain-containing protein [bacterium]